MKTRLRRLVPWLTRPGRPSHPPSHRPPWWVRWFTNGGRPLVAVVVLIMCAPGEHHLAVLAGWDARLAWGMAAVLAAYAGIAASVASNRPKGSPGKASAVIGAFVSLGAAMAAQPVSHLFVTGWFSADPRPPAALVVVVSCVPPLVFGHLLHLAATPVARPSQTLAAEPASPPATPIVKAAVWTQAVPVHARLLPLVPPTARETRRDAPGTPAAHAPWPVAPPAGARLLRLVPPLHAETAECSPETHRFLTTSEVATRHGVAVSTVRTWKDRGRIRPAFVDPQRGAMYDPETLPSAAAVG
ncbi:MerR family transcriptional regulator [Streptomyces lasiicapitis]|uniref:MerR family transcriptional regulator n=1 Tax=Streptomyces lasiicapitis TaxID=1923961 RepID=UPI0036676B8D